LYNASGKRSRKTCGVAAIPKACGEEHKIRPRRALSHQNEPTVNTRAKMAIKSDAAVIGGDEARAN